LLGEWLRFRFNAVAEVAALAIGSDGP